MFINRVEELNILEERLRKGKAEFIVLYGRRRIGKTALLLEFLRRNGGIYLLARETSTHENLKRFSGRIASYFGDSFLRKNPFRSWDAFFEYISERSENRRLVLVIDEFPYLVKGSPELPSILQEYWDLRLKESQIYLVICGSSISMMEKLLGYRSPLYGRRTAQMKLKSLGFFDARAFLPGYSAEEFVMAYGILGGTPAYLLESDDSKGIAENLRGYFRPDSFLYGDALFVLREELEEPRNYFAIMEAIAKGKTTLGEIMNDTGLERATVGKYLSVLIDLDLVKREVPVTASRKSRKGRYRIKDSYFTFWFRYVYPNADMVETGMGDELVEVVMDDLNTYLGFVFEDVAKEFLMRLNRSEKLPFKFTKIGRWWHREGEIDLVALNEREKKALLVEVKWKRLNEREARGILKDLERKSELVGLDGWEKSYGLVAKGVKNREGLTENGWLVWELKDLEALMEEKM
ncbi:MAG: ATP-binding protein [Palaeococcus sp.]|uniref:ATP-binding protein n=1 Tax=Palaeococcus sp. (in: euryarchaeotes) TaxID=2820298 RepID=UPI0025E47356|nr:ATP-binding protein [Palaeococcus sp. (in: euryarchaeotes)]MCD6559424.1 ATP-binding protein [Palaeococcus sp. (in: euryarchaeotes)]